MPNVVENIIPTLNPVYAKRLQDRNQSEHKAIWNLLDNVCDPELPGLTIWDLGVLQDVRCEKKSHGNAEWIIDITPTYSGCPAVEAITQDVRSELEKAGYQNIKVQTVLSPVWSTDMISPRGKVHLKSISIAPPSEEDIVVCPLCDSQQTRLVSQFGSTACKAFYQCEDCLEHFDYFKHF